MRDWKSELQAVDPQLFETPEGRRALCRMNPLLFALIYLPHHLKNDQGVISFGEHHMEWYDLAVQMLRPVTEPRQHRHAFIAPRDSAKSTTWFLIIPLWMAAFSYSRFVAAFADSASQAEMHLLTFRRELDENLLLKEDFPELCKAKRRKGGISEADGKAMRTCSNDFVFMAKGIDSSSLGMKVGERRPDLIVLDDCEPDESNYSAYQMGLRLVTIQDAILPINERARVVLSGTTVMAGSIVHQLIKHAGGTEQDWIKEERFEVHHHQPLLDNADGTQRSLWPEKWSTEYLNSIKHTRSYAKNFRNDPMAMDSEYWNSKDFTYGDIDTCTTTILSIDPATTTSKTSDYTGIAVVGCTKARGKIPRRCVVTHSEGVKLKGAALRQRVLKVIEDYPETNVILIETNQGGDTWDEVFHDMPVKVLKMTNSLKKELRAEKLLNLYQLIPTRVVHAGRLASLEEQMIAYPKVRNDDEIDAVGNAVLRWMKPPRKPKAVRRQRYPS